MPVTAPRKTTRIEGEWRCPKCRHGRHLTAWATALVTGTLDAHGDVDWADGEQSELHEDSIMCSVHHTERPELERWFDGRWRRLAACTWIADDFREMGTHRGPFRCEGGTVKASGAYRFGDYGNCPNCHGNGELWLPIRHAEGKSPTQTQESEER